MNRRRRAFTLVELLTVSFIIAVMVAVTLPAIQYIKQQVLKKRTENALTTIGACLDTYRNEFGDYPPSEPDVVNWTGQTGSLAAQTLRYSQDNKTFGGGSSTNNDLVGFYGSAALLLYLNGVTSDGYSVRHDTTQSYGTGTNVNIATDKVWPPRVQGVPVSQIKVNSPRTSGKTSFAGFQDSWGWTIEYFRAYRNRGSLTANIYPRAVNADIVLGKVANPYSLTFPDASSGVVVGGYNIQVGVAQWLSSYNPPVVDIATPPTYSDYRTGWAWYSTPTRAGSYLLVSPGKDGQFGTEDDITN